MTRSRGGVEGYAVAPPSAIRSQVMDRAGYALQELLKFCLHAGQPASPSHGPARASPSL